MSAPTKKRRWSWRSQAFRGAGVSRSSRVLLVLAAGAYLLHNTLDNMRVRGIQSGFDFITQPAGFAIGESIIAVRLGRELRQGLPGRPVEHACAWRSSASCWPRCSARWSASAACRATSWCARFAARMSSCFRNVAAAAAVVHLVLHPDRVAAADRRGAAAAGRRLLQQERPAVSDSRCGARAHGWHAGGPGRRAAWARGSGRACARARFEATGTALPMFLPGAGDLASACRARLARRRAPRRSSTCPEKTEINVVGGGAVTPEYLTVLIGLTIYTASYIAEIVRGGHPGGGLRPARGRAPRSA